MIDTASRTTGRPVPNVKCCLRLGESGTEKTRSDRIVIKWEIIDRWPWTGMRTGIRANSMGSQRRTSWPGLRSSFTASPARGTTHVSRTGIRGAYRGRRTTTTNGWKMPIGWWWWWWWCCARAKERGWARTEETPLPSWRGRKKLTGRRLGMLMARERRRETDATNVF